MKAKRWMIAEPDAGGVRRLAQEMHCAPLTAAVLSARGIENAAAARAFLSCARSGLHDPFAMHDMDRAVGVIRGAIERGVIYGTGVYQKGEVKASPAMKQAYEMGRSV
mgnify:CR=1 FL=1